MNRHGQTWGVRGSIINCLGHEPSPSVTDGSESDDVVHAWLRAMMFQERLDIVLGDEPRHDAVRIVRVAEIGGSADARGHADRQLPRLQSM